MSFNLAARFVIENADNDYQSTPLGWALHGSEHGWHAETGDFAATVTALLEAGARLPERLEGTDVVREVLRQRGLR